MPFRFIFMLTRNDSTVEDAAVHLRTGLAAGIRHIGFKDVGLSFEALRDLNRAIKGAGASSYLEVVSLDEDSEVTSARAAREIGVDVLLGGTRPDAVLPVLWDSGIQYYPFPGRVVGHPSVLEGTVAEVVDSAISLARRAGIDGLDLLAYRSREDVPTLMRSVCSAVGKPVIVAGSIDSPQRLAEIYRAGAAGFTIGTAALDGAFLAGDSSLAAQLGAITQACTEIDPALAGAQTA